MPDDAPPLRRPWRVMVVEDDALIAMALRLTVEDLGHVVVGEADTVRDAIALARDTRPDAVLMDVRLRGPGDGIDAAQAIRHETGACIVFLTGSSEPETRRRLDALAGPEVCILVKPVRADDVGDALAAVLDRVAQPS